MVALQTTSEGVCVRVFARISASISHEIKNILSIINENAGLLDDFAQMAGDGAGVAGDRVHTIAQVIAQQVDRSNAIMKNLNLFAHSTDSPESHGSLDETLALIIGLTDRQAAMKNITTRLHCPKGLSFSTHLIVFECLVYLTLLTLFKASAEGSTLTVEAGKIPREVSLLFRGELAAAALSAGYPDEEQQVLVKELAADCIIKDNILLLSFPVNPAAAGR